MVNETETIAPEIILPETTPSDTPDRETEVFLNQLNGQEKKQILDHREHFASHAYSLTQAWTGFLIVITLAQFTLKPLGYGLDPKEFIVVFTTTTGAVFGFGLLVGKFLFSHGANNQK